MDTQNIPVHVRLWNKHFWLLAMANLLLVMSSYILVATIPLRMVDRGYSMSQIALVMDIFFIGIYLFGSLSGYLVQRYRRKKVFNVSTLLLLAVTGMLYYLSNLPCNSFDYTLLVVLRFIQGAFYGLSQLVLLSTLIIDTVEAVHRTEANHAATWLFCDFSWSFSWNHGVSNDDFCFSTSLILYLFGCIFCFCQPNKVPISYAK